jgi:hypothetical protein
MFHFFHPTVQLFSNTGAARGLKRMLIFQAGKKVDHLSDGTKWPTQDWEPVHFAEKSWLKVLFADLLWEKNTVQAKKTSWKVQIIRQTNRAWSSYKKIVNIITLSICFRGKLPHKAQPAFRAIHGRLQPMRVWGLLFTVCELRWTPFPLLS